MEIREPLMLGTRAAAALAGFGLKEWQNVVDRGRYPAIPPAVSGRERLFSIDDMLGMFVMRHFYATGMKLEMAGRIASACRRELAKHDDPESLFVVTTPPPARTPVSVVAHRPPNLYSYEVPVRQIRATIVRLAHERGLT